MTIPIPLAGLLPSDIRIAGARIDDFVHQLTPGEHLLIQKAVPGRQQEFATGRVLARRLLSEAGHDDFELLRDEDRVPIWPAGVAGSISHSKELCLAAIGSTDRYRGVGIDLEPDEPVQSGIERIVCRDAEQAWLEAADPEEQGLRCRIVFSVKEAVYKAFYPSLREFWSFQDVGVEIDLAAARFVAEVPRSTGVARVEGRVIRRAGWIVSGIALPRHPGTASLS